MRIHTAGIVIVAFMMLTQTVEAKPVYRERIDSLCTAGKRYANHGQFEESNKIFQTALSDRKLPGKYRKYIYSLLATNADLSGDYSSYCKYLLLKDRRLRTSQEYLTAKMMAELPEQTIERPDSDVTIHYLIDSLYYEGQFAGCEIRLPVTIGGKEEALILDNGCAKYCVASENFAKEHGIRPIGAGGSAIGVVDVVSMWFGVADSLSVGKLTFRNVLFVVIPEKFIDNSVLEINAMLGANFFRMAGEMLLDNTSGTIVFPAVQQERESNVTIDAGGTHYIDAEIAGDTLRLQLDLGAARTALSAKYLLDFEDKVKSCWKEDVSHVGGVGGLKQEKVYSIPELPISACGGVFIRKNAKVSTEKKPNEDDEYGSVGNDFLLSFDRCDINLRDMYLYVEPHQEPL